MMHAVVTVVVVCVYTACSAGLMLYGLNCYVMLYLFVRRRREAMDAGRVQDRYRAGMDWGDLPVVTTQIPVYNEFNVVEGSIRAACAMRYPEGKHEIQILDDSTDDTAAVIDRVAEEMRAKGHDVRVIRRADRRGFKAGALGHGLESARGEFVAIFDADFVPPEDFLLSTVPFFLGRERLGLVQARWGHLNRDRSLLTRTQAVGIDGHFIVEQIARSWNGLFMNFNGTAGVWRVSAIRDSGGWQDDTLTEDLDLSYRVQFRGWQCLYVPHVVVPAELPENIAAFRSQQFRWAKGSFQTLLKILPSLLRMRVSGFKKYQAVLHLGGYFVHPLMLVLALLALPILRLVSGRTVPTAVYAVAAVPLALAVLGPTMMYLVGQRFSSRDWFLRIGLLPVLVVVGVGLAISNSRAILEAILHRPSAFVRTPKRGARETRRYALRPSGIALIETLVGLYCAWTFGRYVAAAQYVTGAFVAIYAGGFLFFGLLSFADSAEGLWWRKRTAAGT